MLMPVRLKKKKKCIFIYMFFRFATFCWIQKPFSFPTTLNGRLDCVNFYWFLGVPDTLPSTALFQIIYHSRDDFVIVQHTTNKLSFARNLRVIHIAISAYKTMVQTKDYVLEYRLKTSYLPYKNVCTIMLFLWKQLRWLDPILCWI